MKYWVVSESTVKLSEWEVSAINVLYSNGFEQKVLIGPGVACYVQPKTDFASRFACLPHAEFCFKLRGLDVLQSHNTQKLTGRTLILFYCIQTLSVQRHGRI